MAATWATATPIGLPMRWRPVMISAYQAEAPSSKGRTRPWKSSARMPWITVAISRLR
jgi:hypothetical protein